MDSETFLAITLHINSTCNTCNITCNTTCITCIIYRESVCWPYNIAPVVVYTVAVDI